MRVYDLFLQGHRLWDIADEGEARARAFYERAQALDPTLAARTYSESLRCYCGCAILHSGKRIGAVIRCNCSGLAQGGKPAARIPSTNRCRSASL